MQVSWRLVFIIEYLGPILIFPFARLININRPLTFIQKLGYLCIMIHFIKREFESVFVHRFSKSSMPFKRLPINCFHYWILCGVMISYQLFSKNYTCYLENHKYIAVILFIAFLSTEIMNFLTHLVLKKLRKPESTTRGIPYKFGFDYVSCANYFWEALSWIIFSLIINTTNAWLFTIISVVQMYIWAKKKHCLYKKEFANYPP